MKIKLQVKIIFCIIVSTVLALCITSYTQLNKISEPLQKDIPLAIQEIINKSRVNNIASKVIYLDEIVNHSVHMYTIKKSVKWKQRYYAYKPLLKDEINNLLGSIDKEEKLQIEAIANSSFQLLKLNQKIINNVSSSNSKNGLDILEGEAY